MSPSMVATAARPSGKKAMPDSRTRRRHGFGSGNVKSSTRKAPGPVPVRPCVTTVSGQRRRPRAPNGSRRAGRASADGVVARSPGQLGEV